MKLETFFEKFDQFADAPDAVEKMRELLLNFAVTGRLSEQRAGDTPVSELIDALSAAKARRGKTGRRDSAAAVPPDSIIDCPIDAPAHWAWVPLNEIGAMSGGMTPSKDKSAFWDGNVNWFSSKDIKTDELTESELKITREATQATGLQVYSPGCLVIVARSGILKRTLPVSILRVEGTVNQDLKVLSPFVGGIERYLQIMLRGMTGFILAELVKTGMTVQSLKYEEFEAQPFPLPPLAEQKRIVARVDELMALCDRLEAQQQERETRHAALARASLARFADAPTPANLDYLFHSSFSIPPSDLRKSILTLAVQGLLVPHDAESADWETRKLKDLTTKIGSGSTPSGGKESYQETGVPLIRSMNVHFGGFVRHGLAFLNDEQAEKLKNVTVKADDVLLNITGASIGRVATAPKDMEGARVNQHVCILRPTAEIIPPFLELFLASPVVQNLIDDVQVGATREALTKSMIEQFEIPVPSLAEQRRIVAKVEQLMALVDALETQLAASRATAANLLTALVAELTGTPHSGKASVPAAPATGRRGRPRKA